MSNICLYWDFFSKPILNGNEVSKCKEEEVREEKYLIRFNRFFNREKLSSTYKPVFLKSFIAVSEYDEDNCVKLPGQSWITKKDEKVKIDLNFIALNYIKQYWEYFFKFKLRQSHTPRDANINNILSMYGGEPKTPSLETLSTDRFKNLRKEVINKSIKQEVLIHLDPNGELYQRNRGEDSIIIDSSLINFFRKYKWILVSALNFIITRYLEKINFVPRIAEKVSGNIPRSYLNENEKKILLDIHEVCFYCNKPYNGAYAMDHVIPFNYLYQTEIFNIVPACNLCNSSKNDRLPIQDIFDKVKIRNRTLHLRKDYSEEWYQKLYDACVISYHGNRPFYRTSNTN